MSLGETIIIMLVMVCVLSPKKLPMVARHLGIVMRYLKNSRVTLEKMWQQYNQQQRLQENIKKAEAADASYQCLVPDKEQ